eukprot:IDg7185t1
MIEDSGSNLSLLLTSVARDILIGIIRFPNRTGCPIDRGLGVLKRMNYPLMDTHIDGILFNDRWLGGIGRDGREARPNGNFIDLRRSTRELTQLYRESFFLERGVEPILEFTNVSDDVETELLGPTTPAVINWSENGSGMKRPSSLATRGWVCRSYFFPHFEVVRSVLQTVVVRAFRLGNFQRMAVEHLKNLQKEGLETHY